MMHVSNISRYRPSVFVMLFALTASVAAAPVRVGDFSGGGNALPPALEGGAA